MLNSSEISRSGFMCGYLAGGFAVASRSRGLVSIFDAVCALALAACGTASSGAINPGGSATLAPTATVASVCAMLQPTPDTSSSPHQVASFSPWQGVPYPPHVTLISEANGVGDGVRSSYSFEVVGLCADFVAPTSVQSLYGAQMPHNGWTQSATFPYKGDISAACGDPYCWKRVANSQTTEYLSLESVHASGTATLFTLRHVGYTVNT